MTRAGSLREQITIRRQVETKNAGGGLDRTWQDVATVRADIRSIDGRESVIDRVLQGISTFQVTIYYRSDLKESDQIVWGDRELNIHAAEDREGRRRWTVITASTETPQGA